MIAKLNPAFCAVLTFSSKEHPPLFIKANEDFESSTIVFVSGEQASRGLAEYNTPHSAEDCIGGAVIKGKH